MKQVQILTPFVLIIKNIDTPFILSSQVQNNNSISLTFNNSPDNLYTLFKIEKRENTFSALYADYFQQQGFAIPQWTDSLQNVTEKSYCYRITKKNQCEIESPVSNESCSILLTGQSLPLQHILNWTLYRMARWCKLLCNFSQTDKFKYIHRNCTISIQYPDFYRHTNSTGKWRLYLLH